MMLCVVLMAVCVHACVWSVLCVCVSVCVIVMGVCVCMCVCVGSVRYMCAYVCVHMLQC